MKYLWKAYHRVLGGTGLLALLLLSYQNCNTSAIHEGHSLLSSAEYQEWQVDTQLEMQSLQSIKSRCLSCHNSVQAQFGINLEGDSKVLLQKNLIIAGQPQSSLLYRSLIAHRQPNVGVSAMPPSSPLADDEIDIMEQWITSIQKPSALNAQTLGYVEDVLPLLENNNCLHCHAETSSSSAALGAYILLDTYDRLMAFVQVGNVNSLLLDSVRSARMPKGYPPLSEIELQTLENWIMSGAKETRDPKESL